MKKNLLFIFLIIFLSLPLFSFAQKVHVVTKVLFTYLDVQGGTAYVKLSDGFGDKTGSVTEVLANINTTDPNDKEYTQKIIGVLEDPNSSDAEKQAAIEKLNNILAFSDYQYNKLVPDGFGGMGIQVQEVIDTGDYVTSSAPISSITLSAQTSPTNKCNADSCQVDVNEEVKFTAIGSGNLDSSKGINWLIDDTTPCSYHDNWGEDCGIFIDCHKKSEVTSSQCADGTICYLYGNQCLKLEPSQITLLNQMQSPTLPTLPNAKCECINNTCQLKYGEMMFLNRIKQLISGIFTQQAQAVNLSSTLTYSWSKKGYYNVYVQGKDTNGNTITSNIITVNVGVPPTTTTTTTRPGPTTTTTTTPGPTPLPSCTILDFTINGKDNSTQNPLIVWVNAPLTGYFSVNDSCKTCTVSSNDTWGNPPKTYPITTLNSSYTETFKITNAGTYSYTLECVGADPRDIAIDTTSLGVQSDGSGGVRAVNLPWWREIIPNLLPFLRGMIR